MKKFCGIIALLFLMSLLITGNGAASFANSHTAKQLQSRSSTPFNNEPTTPASLSKPEWEKIHSAIEKDRYQFHKNIHPDTYLAPNYSNDFQASFSNEGFKVSPRKGKKTWTLALQLNSYGFGTDLHSATEVNRIVTSSNRIEYHRGDLIEWYINDQRGLEQGFTLNSRPAGHANSDLLQIHLSMTTDLLPELEKSGKGLTFYDATGKETIRYSGLYAYDAAGRMLFSRMSVDQEGIHLLVDDHKALYPIVVDPLVETKKLLAADGAASDQFGYSVAIDGDTVVIGATGDDDMGGSSGSAYIFSRNQGGANNWGQLTKLTAADGAASDVFGISVAIHGDFVIVGAKGDDDHGSNSGSAYIFSRNLGGTENWGQISKITAADGYIGDAFGQSVSISSDTVIVGGYLDDDKGDGSGSAYIFSRNQGGADNWGQVKKLSAADGAAGDQFGMSVSISTDTAMVGSLFDDDSIINSGSTYVYSRNTGGTDNWGQFKKISAADPAYDAQFGRSVFINGDLTIIGANGDDDHGSYSGSAYIFSRDEGGVDNWGQVKKLTAADAAAGDAFGISVSISGDLAIVGAQYDDDRGSSSGSAYIFSCNEGGVDNWGQTQKLVPADGSSSDYFGKNVSIDSETAVIGAYHDNDNGDYSGSAYIYSPLIEPTTVLAPVYLMLLDQ